MATRLWTPADMVGVTGLEYFDSTQNVEVGTAASGVTPVNAITAIRPGGGTPTRAASTRDDYRPSLGTVNGVQSIYFGPGIFRLPIATPANLPSGTATKFWFIVTKVRETRTGDYYPLGYGQDQRRSATWKMRQGSVPSGDFGNNGYNVGNVPIAATGISIIVETYRESGPLTRGWYNGAASPSTSAVARPVTNVNAAIGYWPQYGNGTEQDFLAYGEGYGEPTDDDIQRIAGWASWKWKDNGASLASGNPYDSTKSAPTVTDGGIGDNATQNQSATQPALTPRNSVTPATAAQMHVASQPTLTAKSTVAADSATQLQSSTSPTAIARSAVTPDDATQGTVASEPSASVKGIIVVSDGAQGNVASSPALAAKVFANPDSAAMGHAATSPATNTGSSVAPSAGAQAQTATSPTLTAKSIAAPTSANQEMRVTDAPLSGVKSAVVVSGGSQAQTASQPALAVSGSLSVNSGAQAQQGTSPGLVAHAVAAVANGAQVGAATQPGLSWRGSIAANDGAEAQVAGSPIVAARGNAVVDSAVSLGNADSPALIYNASVAPADGAQVTDASQPTLFSSSRNPPPPSRIVGTTKVSRIVATPYRKRIAA